MNNNLDDVFEWVDSLYLMDGYRRYSLNATLFRGKSFSGLINGVYPYLLKQKTIHKKGDVFLTNLSNYLLKKAAEHNIYVYKETLHP